MITQKQIIYSIYSILPIKIICQIGVGVKRELENRETAFEDESRRQLVIVDKNKERDADHQDNARFSSRSYKQDRL
jgi:hypothetical protein